MRERGGGGGGTEARTLRLYGIYCKCVSTVNVKTGDRLMKEETKQSLEVMRIGRMRIREIGWTVSNFKEL